MKIVIEEIDGWYDWAVEKDPNARGTYCGTSRDLGTALEALQAAIKERKRHPFNPKTRTEY